MKKIIVNNQGFTVLEVMVAMAGALLLIFGAIDLYIFSSRSQGVIWEQLSTQNEGRKVVQDFSDEVRRMNYSTLGAYPIESAATSSVVFFTNLDDDSFRERVRYFLSGTTLRKGVIKPSGDPLAYNPATESIVDVVHDVANDSDPVFTYYDATTAFSTTTPLTYPISVTDVRLIKISLMLEEDPTNTPVPFSIESKVEIRNLKSN